MFGCEAVGGSGGDELYEQLWKACAGPLVDVPRAGERVFYFPQGHMEQVSYHYCSLSYSFAKFPFFFGNYYFFPFFFRSLLFS